MSYINCTYCKTEFDLEPKYISRAKKFNRNLYCSKKCEYKSKSNALEEKHCLNCSKPLTKVQFKFCSLKCSAIFNKNRLGTGNPLKRKRYVDKRNNCLYCKVPVTTKYCSNTCYANFKIENSLSMGDTVSHVSMKRYLLEKYGKFCWVCKNESWNNQQITLELDHIDGNSFNNALKNLRILCPNCHSQTLTYKFKNKGKGRFKRMERYRNLQSC